MKLKRKYLFDQEETTPYASDASRVRELEERVAALEAEIKELKKPDTGKAVKSRRGGNE